MSFKENRSSALSSSSSPPPFLSNFVTGSLAACTAETGFSRIRDIDKINYNLNKLSLRSTRPQGKDRAALQEFVTVANSALTYPLDLTKTRMQIHGEVYSKATDDPRTKGMFQTGLSVIKNEGLLRLWHGLSPAVCRQITYSGARITIYEQLRGRVFGKNPDGSFTFWKSAMCGAVAGASAQFFVSPLDLIKVQMQMDGLRQLKGEPPRVHGVVHGLKKIYGQGGLRALWKGWAPNVQRAAVVNLSDLATYDSTKRMLINQFGVQEFLAQCLAGLTAGFTSALVGAPMDVLKARVMNQPINEQGKGIYYKGTIDCLLKSVRNENILVLFKGFLPLWMRLAPFTTVFWLVLERSRKLAGIDGF